MERRNQIPGLAAAVAMLILILDGKTALQGAAAGIDLCIRSVIPALFPFFFLTPLLMGIPSPVFLKPVARWMGLPNGTEGILIPAFLGGYPTGAQAVGRARTGGALSKASAHRALHFCSNAAPSFLFGIIGPQFSDPAVPWLLWAIHIASALLVCRCLPKQSDCSRRSVTMPPCSVQSALSGAVKTAGLVCGWVVLFRIVISFLDRWFFWILPEEITVLLCGLLELSNGCCMLSRIAGYELRFLICTALLSFGGCCIAMQTAAVISGLSIAAYWKGKGMQTLFALGLSALVLPNLPGQAKCLLILPGMFLLAGSRIALRKNNSSNPELSVV